MTVQKITDPNRIATDPVLLSVLAKQGIDRDYVEFCQDYAMPAILPDGKKEKGKSPYAKFYRDLKSDKRFAVFSQLPMVDADGNKIEAGWKEAGINHFSEKNNLFHAEVQGTQVEITVRNDQPDGRAAGDKLSFRPQVFLDGLEQPVSAPTLLDIDPVNPNYAQNTLEWDYGICKRRLRIIEGGIRGCWIFTQNPNGEVRIRYNQTGNFKLKLGQFKVSDDEELIIPAQFEELAELSGYPVTIGDSATFYSGAGDGYVGVVNQGRDSWAAIRADPANVADYTGANFQLATASWTPAGKWKSLYRDHFPIDTSALPDAADITDGEFSIYTYDKTSDYFIMAAALVASTIVSNTEITTGDYQNYGTTRYAPDKAWADISGAGYSAFTLNAAGLAAISKIAWTKLAILFDKDVDNVAPGGPTETWQRVSIYASEQGAGYKPKLVVAYTLPAAYVRNFRIYEDSPVPGVIIID